MIMFVELTITGYSVTPGEGTDIFTWRPQDTWIIDHLPKNPPQSGHLLSISQTPNI
jgi:hypothetical protein